MPYNLKETGESYEQFLKRNRKAERKAKNCLPENKQVNRIWKMERELTELLNDKDCQYWGYMNSWDSDKVSMYKHLIEDGVKFSRVRQNGYWEYYNVKEKIVFKVDSGD